MNNRELAMPIKQLRRALRSMTGEPLNRAKDHEADLANVIKHPDRLIFREFARQSFAALEASLFRGSN